VLIGQVMQASGIGLAISPATTAVMSSIPVTKAGVGSAMNDTTRQMGGALGVAVLGTIATSIYLSGVAPLQATLPPEAYVEVAAGLQTALSPTTQALMEPGQFEVVAPIVREAFMDGMRQSFFVGAMVMYISALFALAVLPDVVRRNRTGQTMEAEAVPAEAHE
jgi:hypothetical protein